MEEIIFLHDFITIILVFIIRFVGYCLLYAIFNKLIAKNLIERQVIECVWTIIPALILIQIAIPSLLLLYILDESIDSRLTIKIIGHQWYWRYEYSDFWSFPIYSSIEYDSYIIPSNELEDSIFRLLDVDNRIVIPFNTRVRLLISSADVIHAWTVPVFGVKRDAVPGRMNIARVVAQRPGVYYGQCSEICGANHRFIPIVVESINSKSFLNWVNDSRVGFLDVQNLIKTWELQSA